MCYRRYCMDSCPQADHLKWKRKGYEVCYLCPPRGYSKVCMACARNCLKYYNLREIVRKRTDGDLCDCYTSGHCLSVYTNIRAQFDKIAETEYDIRSYDGYIGPKRIRLVLNAVRHPLPVDDAEMEDCLMSLAGGEEDAEEPRIHPIPFEQWYRKYYSEY